MRFSEMTSELITFNHLRCHSSSIALGTRTGYWKPTQKGTVETPQRQADVSTGNQCSSCCTLKVERISNKPVMTTTTKIMGTQLWFPKSSRQYTTVCSGRIWIKNGLRIELSRMYHINLDSATICKKLFAMQSNFD